MNPDLWADLFFAYEQGTPMKTLAKQYKLSKMYIYKKKYEVEKELGRRITKKKQNQSAKDVAEVLAGYTTTVD